MSHRNVWEHAEGRSGRGRGGTVQGGGSEPLCDALFTKLSEGTPEFMEIVSVAFWHP